MSEDSGRVPAAPGSREPDPQAVPALRASIPSREAGLSWIWRHEIIAAILTRQEEENADRPDFTPAISRTMLERAVSQLLGIYDCRPSDTAAAYGWMGLWRILGLDWEASKLVFLPSDSDGSSEAGETPKIGSTEGDSAGRQASPEPDSPSPLDDEK